MKARVADSRHVEIADKAAGYRPEDDLSVFDRHVNRTELVKVRLQKWL